MNLFEQNKQRITKNLMDSYVDLEKGVKANIGEIRQYDGKDYQKQSDGKWKRFYGKEEKSEKKGEESLKVASKKDLISVLGSSINGFKLMQDDDEIYLSYQMRGSEVMDHYGDKRPDSVSIKASESAAVKAKYILSKFPGVEVHTGQHEKGWVSVDIINKPLQAHIKAKQDKELKEKASQGIKSIPKGSISSKIAKYYEMDPEELHQKLQGISGDISKKITGKEELIDGALVTSNTGGRAIGVFYNVSTKQFLNPKHIQEVVFPTLEFIDNNTDFFSAVYKSSNNYLAQPSIGDGTYIDKDGDGHISVRSGSVHESNDWMMYRFKVKGGKITGPMYRPGTSAVQKEYDFQDKIMSLYNSSKKK